MPPAPLLGEMSEEMVLTKSSSPTSNNLVGSPPQTEQAPAATFSPNIDEGLTEFGTVVESEETATEIINDSYKPDSSDSLLPEPELLTITEEEFDLDEELLQNSRKPISLVEPQLKSLPEPESPQLNTLSSGPMLGFDSSSLRDDLKIEVRQQEQVQIGNGALFEVFLQNTGAETFDNLKLRAAFSQDLFLPGRETHDLGKKIAQLDPAQELKIPLTLFSETPGRHCVRFSLLDEQGDELAGESACVEFIPEVVQLKIAGPEICSIDSPAKYLLQVKNLSEEELNEVRVQLTYDSVLNFKQASSEPQVTEHELSWNLSRLSAGESVSFEATFDCKTVSDNSSLVLNVSSPQHPDSTAASFLKIERPLSPVDLSFISESSLVAPDKSILFAFGARIAD